MQKTHEIQPMTVAPTRAYSKGLAVRTALLALPFALAGTSMAAGEVEALSTSASTGVGGIVTTVATIAGVALTIGLIVWGVRKMKPTN